MKNKYVVSGYELVRKTENTYTAIVRGFDNNNKRVVLDCAVGSLLDASEFLIGWGVDQYELQDAVLTMEDEFHEIAHFGIMGTFLFSVDSAVTQ